MDSNQDIIQQNNSTLKELVNAYAIAQIEQSADLEAHARRLANFVAQRMLTGWSLCLELEEDAYFDPDEHFEELETWED